MNTATGVISLILALGIIWAQSMELDAREAELLQATHRATNAQVALARERISQEITNETIVRHQSKTAAERLRADAAHADAERLRAALHQLQRRSAPSPAAAGMPASSPAAACTAEPSSGSEYTSQLAGLLAESAELVEEGARHVGELVELVNLCRESWPANTTQ